MADSKWPSRRFTLILGAGVLLIAALGAGWFVSREGGQEGGVRGSTGKKEPAFWRTARGYAASGEDPENISQWAREENLRDEQWAREAEFMPISAGAQAMASQWLRIVRDPDDLLTPAQERTFVEKLVDHARVRAESTPDDYIALIEGDPMHVWSGPEEVRGNGQVVGFFKVWLERAVDPNKSTIDLVRDVWSGLVEHGLTFRDVGVGEKGAAILVVNARVPSQVQSLGYSGKDTVDIKYWRARLNRMGMPFSRATRTLGEALAEHPSAPVVFVHIIVRMNDERIVNWMSVWFLDPETNQWVNDYIMQTSSTMFTPLVW